MAMTTYLQAVSEDELAALEDDPSSINALNQPPDQSFTTQVPQTLCYFWCGDGYPTADDHGPLAAALMGFESVDAPTLENGVFDLVRAESAAQVADALDGVDLDELAAEVDDTDLESLVDEEELFDVEPLIYDDVDLSEMIVRHTVALRDFYRRAAEDGLSVVMYTT